jgi:hypothetical protein
MGAKLGFSLLGRDRLRVFEKRVLDLKGRKTDRGENCIMMNFTACILHRIFLG